MADGERTAVRVAVPRPRIAAPGLRATLYFRPPGVAPVRVHVAGPPRLGPHTRTVIVLHGVLRNPEEYIEAWADWAAAENRLVACPGFDSTGWGGSRAYNMGNVMPRGGGDPLPEEKWVFTVVESLHQHMRGTLALADACFDLWGHSAGAQVAHRFPLFKPRAPLRRVVAAGAGWYTLPDPGLLYPYGLGHPRLGLWDVRARAWLQAPLTLMRGSRDVVRDEHLRTKPEAEAQGPTRFDRAAHMLDRARALDPNTRWRLLDVPGAGHEHAAMAKATQQRWHELAGPRTGT